MSSQLRNRKTGRHTSLHRRPGALHPADIGQLQLFDMLLSDTRALVNKVAGSGGYGLPGIWQECLVPPMTFTETDARAAPLSFTAAVGAGVFTVIPGNQT